MANSKPMTKTEIAEMFLIWARNDPSPTTELEYSNPFTLLVAVVLSAQATDVGVNKATKDLFKIADTPEKMFALGEDGLKEHIKTIGLYHNKAKNVIALSKRLIDVYDSKVLDDQKALESLPGVGRKTANVVRNTLFAASTIAVDTHVFRMGNRTGLAVGKTPLDVEKGLLKRVPKDYIANAHHWLILHGRYVCLARKPKCNECSVAHLCHFSEKVA